MHDEYLIFSNLVTALRISRWHLLTAAAVYVYMVLVEHLAAESTVEASVEAAGAYAWPVMSTLSNSGDMVKRE